MKRQTATPSASIAPASGGTPAVRLNAAASLTESAHFLLSTEFHPRGGKKFPFSPFPQPQRTARNPIRHLQDTTLPLIGHIQSP